MITWTFRILRLARFLKIEAIREYAFGTDVLCRQSFKLSKQFLRGERMRFLLGVCGCFIVLASSAMAQQFGEYNSPSETYVASAWVQESAPINPTAPATQGTVAQQGQAAAPQQTAPVQPAPLQTSPQTAPGAFDFNAPVPGANDGLDLDSTQDFNFDDSGDFQFDSTSNFENSIASNSNFRSSSPQMIGDFGGGSNIIYFPAVTPFPLLGDYLESVPVPLAGGSRRIKAAENNQVMPLNRVYGTFNYFHNAYQGIVANPFAGTTVRSVQSESLIQYTFGVEKTFLNDYFSIDLRMPFTSGVDLGVSDPLEAISPSSTANSGEVGNLSTSIKALLLTSGESAISGGLQISIPTGSDAVIVDRVAGNTYRVQNDAVHLMPFIGAYHPFGDSWWLQSFLQVDTPANGNAVLANGVNIGRLTAQTLLYSDVSLGKWLYRNPSNSPRRGGRGVTGIASLLELHYTSSLTDADIFSVAPGPGFENRFDALNLTAGLLVEFSEKWRLNIAGAFPLKGGRWDGGRTEDRFFDSEFSFHLNRFF